MLITMPARREANLSRGQTTSPFDATSVRDPEEINVIIRGEHKKPIDVLDPQGRVTFLLERKTIGVYTEGDLEYNANFDVNSPRWRQK